MMYRRKPHWTQLQRMRHDLERMLEPSGRWFLLGKLLFVGLLLLVWMRIYDFSFAVLGVFQHSFRASIGIGLLAGVLAICGKGVFPSVIRLAPIVDLDARRPHPQSKGPVALWLLTFFLGGVVEEPWRAFSLLAWRQEGWGELSAVIATSIGFVIAQESGGFPSRIASTDYERLWQFLMGVFLAILFLRFGTIVIPYVAFLIFNVANFVFIRRLNYSGREVRRSEDDVAT
jgi:hypothetical protein